MNHNLPSSSILEKPYPLSRCGSPLKGLKQDAPTSCQSFSQSADTLAAPHDMFEKATQHSQGISSRSHSEKSYAVSTLEALQKATPQLCVPINDARNLYFNSYFGASALRPLTVNDTDWVYENLFSNREVLQWYRDGTGRTREETFVFLQERQEAWQKGLLAGYCIYVGDERAGYLGCGAVRAGMMEIGYAIKPKFWGRGLATASVRRAVELFDQLTPSFHCVFATAHPANAGSNAVLKKAGFTYVENEGRIEYKNAPRNFYFRHMPWRNDSPKAA